MAWFSKDGVQMAMRLLPWERFWVPRDGSFTVGADGFLLDPLEANDYYSPNPDLQSTDSLLSHRCVILLGEPGMGKSTELRRLCERADSASETVELIDLMDYGDEGRLVDALDAALARLSDAGDPVLLVDSLDECRRRITTVARVLTSRIRRAGIPNLKLRIACRTGDWMESLERSLEDIYTDVLVRELTPLRRVDVREACAEVSVEFELFEAEIARERLQTFAGRPLTLNLLLEEFELEGALPGQLGVFGRALDRLLAEQSAERLDASLEHVTSLDRRREVASHLALTWLLTDSHAFWRGPEPRPEARGVLSMSTVPLEVPHGRRIAESEMREVLGSALFSARGRQLVGWAHRSFAEYLAAARLQALQLPMSQLENIFFDKGSAEGRIFPQLREVAGWLVALDAERIGHWVQADPLGILLAAVRLPSSGARAQLVASLLSLMEHGLLQRWLRVELRHLGHPGLSDQLRPIISTPGFDEPTRNLAIDIAEACQAVDVADACVAVALDEAEADALRVNAAHAALRLGDSDDRRQLVQLADGTVDGDASLELKGIGLEAGWPDALDFEKVLGLLESPPPSFFGAYRRFIDTTLPGSIGDADVMLGLRFASSAQIGDFDRLVDGLVQEAWDENGDDTVSALAELMLCRAKQYEPFFLAAGRQSEQAPENQERRRALIAAMIDASDGDHRDAYHIADHRLGLIKSSDFAWLLALATNRSSGRHASLAASVAIQAFDPLDTDHVEAAASLDRDSILWREHLKHWFEAVELDSETADRQRRYFEMSRARDEVSAGESDAQDTNADLRVRMSTLLDDIELHGPEQFWQLNLVMLVDPESEMIRSEYQFDLELSPGWDLMAEADRVRVVDAAKAYLAHEFDWTNDWVGTDTLFRPAVAGYRALVLLLHLEPGFLDVIRGTAWERWAPAVVWAPDPHVQILDTNAPNENHPKLALLERAYGRAPGAVRAALRALIVHASERPDGVYTHDESLRRIYDPTIEAMLLEAVANGVERPIERVLLDVVLECSVNAGGALIRDMLADRSSGESQRNRALSAVIPGLKYRIADIWPVLSEAMNSDPEFGRSVLLTLGAEYQESPFSVQSIGEAEVGRLLVWMFQQFPPSEDPSVPGVHMVGSREEVSRLRENVLQDLINCGTPSAASEVDKLATAFPEYPWLRQRALQASEIALRNEWQPLTPNQVQDLVSNNGSRVVHNTSQLQGVVVESLERLNERMQSSPPESLFLWDERSELPTSEDRLSDYVIRHLRDDIASSGIIANREVQILNWRRSGIGERTDILVESPGDDGLLRVVIETKGCWNSGLLTAMKDQLWDQYMNAAGTKYGIYLVGWFDHWDWSDDERGRHGCGGRTRDNLLSILSEQAEDLRGDGAVVRAIVLDCTLGSPTASERS